MSAAESSSRKTTSSLVSRNVVVDGRRTSIRLEPSFWDALFEIAAEEGRSINEICSHVKAQSESSSFTAAMRVYALGYFRQKAAGRRP